MNLHDILLQKGRASELAHFYLLEASGAETENAMALQAFVREFIRDYYQKIEDHKQSLDRLRDHPGVFIMGNLLGDEDPQDGFFSVEESEALNRFFEFRPVQGKRQFAVITEAHRINTTVANKWLKLLEEPQGESTIFLLNPRRQKLLDTIHSRALHLRLQVKTPEVSSQEWPDFLSSLKDMTLSKFLETHVKSDLGLDFWVKELIRWESDQNNHADSKKALENWLKSYQEMDLFHQPAATKWALFYSYLHQHVLPRL